MRVLLFILSFFAVAILTTVNSVACTFVMCFSINTQILEFFIGVFGFLHPADDGVIPAKAFARDYVVTGVGLSVCLSVCLFVTTITK